VSAASPALRHPVAQCACSSPWQSPAPAQSNSQRTGLEATQCSASVTARTSQDKASRCPGATAGGALSLRCAVYSLHCVLLPKLQRTGHGAASRCWRAGTAAAHTLKPLCWYQSRASSLAVCTCSSACRMLSSSSHWARLSASSLEPAVHTHAMHAVSCSQCSQRM
jgi:hypothetical protein